MRRGSIFAAVIGLALVCAGSAAAADPNEEATDRLTEGLFQVDHDRVIDGQTVRGGAGEPFMVANPGNAVALIAGCESSCNAMRVTVRVAGQRPIQASPSEDWPGLVVLRLPTAYMRALSNYEVDFDIGCPRDVQCVMRWALLADGPARSLEQRGLPRRLTQAEWNEAQQPPVTGSALQWQTLPSGEDLRFFYPVEQWRAGAEGAARLQCILGERGRLRCRSEAGAPDAFADAALRLSSVMRLSETDASGASLRGRRIVVPIRFQSAGS